MLGKLLSLFKRDKRPRIDPSRFRFEADAGKGSMGKVLRARDTEHKRRVAVKILDKDKLEQLTARYARDHRPPEWEIAVKFRHPNVIRTFEYGLTKDGEQVIVMELVDGLGLNYLLEADPETLRGHRIGILLGAAGGLAYMHRIGYVHRDVCSRNIMVDKQFNAKLIDFGLTVPNLPEFNRPGRRTGTAAYMAPELIRRAPTDHRVDIFSFGVTMYETLTGTLPWGAAESLKVAVQHMNTDPPPPSSLVPDIDPPLERLIMRALAREPEKRYQKMEEVVRGLERLERTDY